MALLYLSNNFLDYYFPRLTRQANHVVENLLGSIGKYLYENFLIATELLIYVVILSFMMAVNKYHIQSYLMKHTLKILLEIVIRIYHNYEWIVILRIFIANYEDKIRFLNV